MVGRPRRDIIDEDRVGVYHCWSRCDRGSPLCGRDPVSGRCYEHRKAWIVSRLQQLVRGFAVDACVYAIMSNHYHLIMRNRPDLVEQWSDEEVARRWWWLCPERKDARGVAAEPHELEIRSMVADKPRIQELRWRLSSISWFMKFLGEQIAKRANAEDGVTGRFWGDRFSCRDLLDEGAVLACSVYVDLNEIRAHLAGTPETSRYTSGYHRILAQLIRLQRAAESGVAVISDFQPEDPDFWLCPLPEQERAPLLVPDPRRQTGELPAEVRDELATVFKRWRHGFLPVSLHEYLQLLDWTGRQLVLEDKGAIDNRLAPILERLGLNSETWLELVDGFGAFHGAVGSPASMAESAERTGRRWVQGVNRCRDHFR